MHPRLNPHVQICPEGGKRPWMIYSFFHRIKQTGASNLFGQNPGAASSLDEVFLSLVRLRRDGSARVFWKDKLEAPVYLNI